MERSKPTNDLMGLALRKLHWPQALTPKKHRRFVYPPLARSKNQLRLLELAPGDPNDGIIATIATKQFLALPLNSPKSTIDGLIDELAEIYERLSTALITGSDVPIEQLLRWERVHVELNKHYLMLYIYEDASKYRNRIQWMIDARGLFINQVQRYESIELYRDLCKVHAMQALVKRLKLVIPTPKTDTWGFDPEPERGYVAVSYCCGDQTIKEDIILNNVRVQIPASAARALRGVRSGKGNVSKLPVWIDAICINPDDPRERAHQVLLMARIYSSALSTLVWLDHECEMAHEQLSVCFSEWDRHLENVYGATLVMESIFDANSDLPESARCAARELFASLWVYLQQPYFSRLWVYQEVLLSPRVYLLVGQHTIPWLFLRVALEHYEDLFSAAESSVLGAAGPWCRRVCFPKTTSGWRSAYIPPSLTELLLETLPFDCLDPRDKVYALLGLTSWSIHHEKFPDELEPDYTLPIEECMRNATLAAIGERGSAECLTLPVWTKRKPTWVVPWQELEIGCNRLPHVAIEARCEAYYGMPDCSRGQKVNLSILRQPGRLDSLYLEGCRFSKVFQVSEMVCPQDVEGLSFEQKLERVVQRVKQLLAGQTLPRLASFFILSLWWRFKTVENGKLGSGLSGGDMRLSFDSFEEQRVEYQNGEQAEYRPDGDGRFWLHDLIEHLRTKPDTIRDDESPSSPPPGEWDVKLTEGLDWSISNSRFYLATTEQTSDTGTTEYMLGCGPNDMEPGDEVVMLHGSRVPVVLRPEHSWWLLVGPAFSHTLRDATFIFNSPPPGSDIEVFEIR
jgi:hypothetical protein